MQSCAAQVLFHLCWKVRYYKCSHKSQNSLEEMLKHLLKVQTQISSTDRHSLLWI